MEGLTRQFVPLLQAFLPGDLVSIVVSYDVVPTRLVVQVTSKDTGREDLYSTPNLLREHKLECLVLDSMLYFDDGQHILFPVSLRQPKLCEPDFVRSEFLVVQGLTTNALSQERLVTLCLDKKKRSVLFQIQDETLELGRKERSRRICRGIAEEFGLPFPALGARLLKQCIVLQFFLAIIGLRGGRDAERGQVEVGARLVLGPDLEEVVRCQL
jgi:hypothetical protein